MGEIKKKYEYVSSELWINYEGRSIYGKLFAPQTKEQQLSTVILSHGYNGTCETVADVARCLAETGVVAYCFDFCGGSVKSKSSGKSTEMSLKTEQEDLKAVIKSISVLDIVDKNRLYLYGESQGGLISSLVAAGLTDKIKGLLLLYPAFCIPDDWNKRKAEGMTDLIDCMGMTLSRKFCDELPGYDVFEYIRSYKNRVVIYQGDKDRLVSSSYAKRAEEGFENARLVMFEGEGHGFSREAREKLREMVCEYLEE